MKTLILSIAGLAAITIAPIRAAEAGEGRQQARQKLEALRDDLDLTADQKQKIKTILSSHRTELLQQWQSSKSAREAMQAAVKDHGANSPEANTAARDLGEVARKRALLVASLSSEVKPILTPEQIGKLESAREGFSKWLQQQGMARGA